MAAMTVLAGVRMPVPSGRLGPGGGGSYPGGPSPRGGWPGYCGSASRHG